MKFGYGEIVTFVGDVWELATQCFISPIHAEMHPCPGIGANIVRRAGPEVAAELRQRDSISLGHALVTKSGDLRCQTLIHIAISTLATRPDIADVEDSIEEALTICQRQKIRSVAIPAVAIEPGELPVSGVAISIVRLALRSLKISSSPERIVCVVPSGYVENLFQRVIDDFTYRDATTAGGVL